MNDQHVVNINKVMRAQLGINGTEEIDVELEFTVSETPLLGLEIPPNLQTALDNDEQARAGFDAQPPSHQKEWILWISEAKRPETRARRVSETIRLLKERKRSPYARPLS